VPDHVLPFFQDAYLRLLGLGLTFAAAADALGVRQPGFAKLRRDDAGFDAVCRLVRGRARAGR
jgi:hypothetical protein